MLQITFTDPAAGTLHASDLDENPGGCHVLTVRRGEHTAASTFEQWQTDPAAELTRLLGVLSAGRPARSICDSGHGESVLTVTGTGRQLRFACAPQDCDYVRVCETDDTGTPAELAYWSCDEFADDPELVAGALIGALMGGAIN